MKYIIFGAGRYSSIIILKMLENKLNISFIVDNNKEKVGTELLGIPVNDVSSLNSIEYDKYQIILSVKNKENRSSIENQLNSMGLRLGKEYFDGLELFGLRTGNTMGRVSGFVSVPEGFQAIKSYADDSRLIVDKTSERIFRYVSYGHEDEYRRVFNKCKEGDLLGSYIINTWESEEERVLQTDLVLEHDFIKWISYSFEWSPEMFKSYVKFMIKMISMLEKNGLYLKDAHALNATIYSGRFVFIDFGAIKEGKQTIGGMLQFLNTHLLPLFLMSKNRTDKAYLYMKNPGIELTLEDVQGACGKEEFEELNKLYDVMRNSIETECFDAFLDELSAFVNRINIMWINERWNTYQSDEWNISENKAAWSEKMINAHNMIKRVEPESIIDLAGNMGWYSVHLYKETSHITVVDITSDCLDNLWIRVNDMKMTNVLPVYMSILTPSLGYYCDNVIESSGSIEAWREGAIKRFKSEMVIALAILHHLVFSQMLSFREIVRLFSSYSEKFLLVEFIDRKDKWNELPEEGFSWYSEDAFVKELETEFSILDVAPSSPENTRRIYLCEKKVGGVIWKRE